MTTTTQRTTTTAWLVVAMLWLVCFLNYADRQAIFSVFPLLKAEFGLSDVQLGVVASCFMWVYAVSGPVAGWITDRVSRTAVVIGALSFWSLMTVSTAWAHSYHTLVLVRGLAGLGEAFYFPSAMSLIASYHGPATRSRAMSIHQSSVYAGTIVGGSMSAYVAQRSGWRDSFELLGGLGILLALVVMLFLRDPVRTADAVPIQDSVEKTSRSGFADNLLAVIAKKPVLLMIAVFMGANFVAVIFLTWMPTFLQRRFSMGLGAAGFNGTVYVQAASVVGVIAGGFLADGLSRRRRGGRQLVQALGLLGGVPFLFFTGHTTTVGVLFGAMAGFGLCKGLYDANIWASLYDFVEPARRGLATGLMNSLGWLGGGFAPVIVAAAAARYGLGACISMTSGLYLLLGVCMGVLFLKRRADGFEGPSRGVEMLKS